MLEDFGKAAIEFFFSSREYYDMVEYRVNTYPGDRKFFYKGNDCLFFWDGTNNYLTMVVDDFSLPFVEYALDYGYDQNVFPHHWRINMYKGRLPSVQQWDYSLQAWYTICCGGSGMVIIRDISSLVPYYRVVNEDAKIRFTKEEYIIAPDPLSPSISTPLTFNELVGVC